MSVLVEETETRLLCLPVEETETMTMGVCWLKRQKQDYGCLLVEETVTGQNIFKDVRVWN